MTIQVIDIRALQQRLHEDRADDRRASRRYFGRSLQPGHIEAAIYSASCGHMRDLTDLIYESKQLDPTFEALASKRVNALASFGTEVVPSEDAADAESAGRLADAVRVMLRSIPWLSRSIRQLEWGTCFGRAAVEVVWRRTEGPIRWQPARLEWVHPRRLSLGPEREVRVRDDVFSGLGFEARGIDTREVPGKFLVSQPQLFGDYTEREGFGLRGVFWTFFKRFSWRERLELVELFGKPWRGVEVADGSRSISKEVLDQASEQVDQLGAGSTFRLPPGLKLVTVQPHPNTHEGHQALAQDANDELAKLILGQSRTTEAKSSGLNAGAEEVAQDSEFLILKSDGEHLSEVLTQQLCWPFIALNFGHDAMALAPRIRVPVERPPDRSEEIKRTVAALQTGLPLKRDEVYERLGFSRPADDDDTVTVNQGGATGNDPFAATRREALSRLLADNGFRRS